MKNFLLVMFTMLSGFINAQDLEIIGKWKVKEVISQEISSGSEGLIDGLSLATFDFKRDRSFRLESSLKAGSFVSLLESTRNSMWEYDVENSTINIKKRGKESVIMKIKVAFEGPEIIFTFEESNLVMEVEKVI